MRMRRKELIFWIVGYVALFATWSLGSLLVTGCSPRYPGQKTLVGITAQSWREQGLPWRARCDAVLRSVEVRCGNCESGWDCVLGAKVYLPCDDLREREKQLPGTTQRTAVHGVWHVLHSCSEGDFDSAHASGRWENAVPSALREAQSRVRERLGP